MRPVGAMALLGAIAIQAGFIVNGTALDEDGSADRLIEASTGDADGQLLLGLVIAGLGFVALAPALTFLFSAAKARAEKMLGALVAFAIVGALMIGGGLILNHFAYLNAADDFVAAEQQREAAPQAPGGEGAEEQGTAAEEQTDEDAEEEADDRARDAQRDAELGSLSGLLVRGGALLFGIGFLYTSLWSMRTGLLSRFWGSLGMAAAVVLALFFLYLFTLVWALAIGLFLLGAWFGRRPPAWESGTAMPWPKAGEQPREDPEDAVEGTGRERTELPLPEGEVEAPRDEPPGPPPRKRKRRS